MDKVWLDGLPLHPPDAVVPVEMDAHGEPLSVGEPIERAADGRLTGEIAPGVYTLVETYLPRPD